MSGAPPSAVVHASDPPSPQPVLPAASQPLLPASTSALVAPSTRLPSGAHGVAHVMTNEQLTQGLLGILQRFDVLANNMQALHDGQQALQQALLAVQPGLQHPLLPSSSATAAKLPGPSAPPTSAAAPVVQPSTGVPIHMISFPPSPSPIPSSALRPPPPAPPIYSSTTPITTAVPLSSASPTALTAFGGVPASGTLYGGVDGTLFPSIPGSSMAGGAPSQDRTSPVPPPA